MTVLSSLHVIKERQGTMNNWSCLPHLCHRLLSWLTGQIWRNEKTKQSVSSPQFPWQQLFNITHAVLNPHTNIYERRSTRTLRTKLEEKNLILRTHKLPAPWFFITKAARSHAYSIIIWSGENANVMSSAPSCCRKL